MLRYCKNVSGKHAIAKDPGTFKAIGKWYAWILHVGKLSLIQPVQCGYEFLVDKRGGCLVACGFCRESNIFMGYHVTMSFWLVVWDCCAHVHLLSIANIIIIAILIAGLICFSFSHFCWMINKLNWLFFKWLQTTNQIVCYSYLGWFFPKIWWAAEPLSRSDPGPSADPRIPCDDSNSSNF